MKNLCSILIALICYSLAIANPLIQPPPQLEIAELAFDDRGDWKIELALIKPVYSSGATLIDSIFLISSTGRSKLKNINLSSPNYRILLRADSLIKRLVVRSLGDSVQVEYYIRNYPRLQSSAKTFSQPVVFGNFKNATLQAPKIGQSIAYIWVFSQFNRWNINSPIRKIAHSIDKSPSFGTEKDTTGMCGTLRGKIFDKDNLLFNNPGISISVPGLNDFRPNTDGTFSARAFSYKNKINQIFCRTNSKTFTVDIVPIYLDVMPNSVISTDFRIILVTNIKETKSEVMSPLKISPNPIKEMKFNYDITIPVKSSNSYIELVDLSGRKCGHYAISQNSGTINLPENTKNGIYMVHLIVNSKSYAATKLMIAK